MGLVFGNNSRLNRRLFFGTFLFFAAAFVSAQVSQQNQPSGDERQPLVELGDEYQNSIKLLQNRFRIDYEVEEITMVFFREFGSAPIVLVRPDGSKIFQIYAEEQDVYWYDSTTFDLIKIENPMPGPWQAVGQILPDSRVMVLSDINLVADPLPEVMFSGEILKQTATLMNGDKPIDNAEFRDVVSLEIVFASTNNPNFNNFGAESQTIAIFEDNGRGMDERPLDGTFTGQFNLSIANGEWSPVFTVRTPMLTREQKDDPLMLYPNPISIDLIEDGGGDGFHKLVIDAKREFVDMKTLLIDGKVRFPNGDVQNFSLTEQSPDAREYLIVNYESGVYRIKLTAYGNTKSGRDFILDVPEYTHLVEDTVVVPPTEQGQTTQTSTDEGTELATMPNVDGRADDVKPEENEGMSSQLFWILVVSINVIVLGGGAGVLWWFLTPKKNKPSKNKVPKKAKQAGENKPNFVQTLLSKFKKSPKSPDTKQKNTVSENNEKDAGMIDLSLPKDS